MSIPRVACSECSGAGLVKDPSRATLPELEQTLHTLDVTRDWIAGLIEERRQDVRRWHLGRHSKAEQNRKGKTAAA